MLVEMFERRPESGKQVRHRKVMPNRNWLEFSEVSGTAEGNEGAAPPISELQAGGRTDKYHGKPDGYSQRLAQSFHWHKHNYAFDKKSGYPSTLGPVSNPDGTGIVDNKKVHEHHHGPFCHHKNSKSLHRSHKKVEGDTTNKSEAANAEPASVVQNGKPGAADESGVRIRMWLESRKKEPQGRQFASYQCVVPNLVTQPKSA